ncbi:MAG: hypothetical protein SCK57_02865 [Bacillota bacterium]|nr:hypothetical protein [Bacillota bacterium]MDW7676581.1 hypothetical protein [Bacillota bacterium]
MFLKRNFKDGTTVHPFLIHINPGKVHYHAGSNAYLTKWFENKIEFLPGSLFRTTVSIIRMVHPFIIPRMLYPSYFHIKDHLKYQKIQDLMENRHDLRSTMWFNLFMKELRARVIVRYKDIEMRNEQDILDFLSSYMLGLIDSISIDGYREDKCAKPGKAFISADGSLHKCSQGDHRFYVARLLNVKQIPLSISGIHRSYFLHMCSSNERADLPLCLRKMLREVEVNHQ